VRWILGVWLIVCGGCASLLDLDDTTDVAFDLDADGVSDQHDNCTGVANPTQSDDDDDGVGDDCDSLSCPPDGGASINRDVDRDGVDDGCDACLLGPNDDEDADGLPDRCDPCPAIADPHADSDEDSVGDACDLATTRQRRLLFDGFGPGPHPWVDPGWRVENGALLPALDQSTTTVGTMAVNLPTEPGWFASLGLGLGTQGSCSVTIADSDKTAFCTLTYDGAEAKYRLDAGYSVPPPYVEGQVVSTWVGSSQQVDLRMRLDPDTFALICEVGPVNARLFIPMIPSAVPELMATPGIVITYVDLVR
jgi:Thrombospondin type 3 repeat